SSRRRHTRSKRDWSSDVCSSDLGKPLPSISMKRSKWMPVIHFLPRDPIRKVVEESAMEAEMTEFTINPRRGLVVWVYSLKQLKRSEERRVGKECRRGCTRGHWKT